MQKSRCSIFCRMMKSDEVNEIKNENRATAKCKRYKLIGQELNDLHLKCSMENCAFSFSTAYRLLEYINLSFFRFQLPFNVRVDMNGISARRVCVSERLSRYYIAIILLFRTALFETCACTVHTCNTYSGSPLPHFQ